MTISKRLLKPAKQQGVALITMLMVFAIVAVMAAEMLNRLYFDIRKTGAVISDIQARQYALGGEALARQILYSDFELQEDALVDDLNEAWAASIPIYETDGGAIDISVVDLNSRFNLNSLVSETGQPNNDKLQLFKRLLQQLDIDVSLATLVMDWLDADSTPQSYKGEDQSYLSLEPSYRTANGKITHVSELRAINGFEDLNNEQWQRLLSNICVLPNTTPFNVNTATESLLGALHNELKVSAVVAYRQTSEPGFDSIESFMQSDATAGLDLDSSILSVHSEYFQVQILAQFQGRQARLLTTLHRDPESGVIKLLQRELLPFWDTLGGEGEQQK